MSKAAADTPVTLPRAMATAFALGCRVAVVIIMVGLVAVNVRGYDVDHPDHAHFAERFLKARRALGGGETRVVIDLVPVNGGSWRTACLFGGYTSPIDRMEALGATISPWDRVRLTVPTNPLRISPVEEFEMVIGYVDEQGRAHFVHFAEGVGGGGQHYNTCVTKPQTTVAVDDP
jgi:hypothetical protein